MNNKKHLVLAIALVLCAITATFGQQKWGIGLRLGDPTGITFKHYMEKTAIEINVGRTHNFSRGHWYNSRFKDWYADQNFNYSDFQYLGYRSSTPIAIQGHYLFRNPISSLGELQTNGLEWYFGFGGQIRHQRLEYDYRYKVSGSPFWNYRSGERVNDFDIGTDGVIGAEYFFNNIPLAVFVDITLFMELADDPFQFYGQGGLGARYLF